MKELYPAKSNEDIVMEYVEILAASEPQRHLNDSEDVLLRRAREMVRMGNIVEIRAREREDMMTIAGYARRILCTLGVIGLVWGIFYPPRFIISMMDIHLLVIIVIPVTFHRRHRHMYPFRP